MMSKMRELSKIFIVIVALSFIALMVFEWGMDYTGMGQRQNVVGSVNGQELTYEMFTDMFQNLFLTTNIYHIKVLLMDHSLPFFHHNVSNILPFRSLRTTLLSHRTARIPLTLPLYPAISHLESRTP